MRILSLFAGIGGLEVGLEAAIPGAHTVCQVEIDPYCRGVLAKHWPDADRRLHDVRLVHRLYATPAGEVFTAGALPRVDLVCGGFPCQDLSTAGKGAGLDGERSGLWWQVWRIVRDLRPRYVVLENVAALVVRGLDVVLGALAELGYDAEWAVFGASDVGAPHRRRRIAIVAYLPDADAREEPGWWRTGGRRRALGNDAGMADADAHGRSGLSSCGPGARLSPRDDAYRRCMAGWDHRPAQPRVGGAADGIPGGLDRARWEADVPRVAPSARTTTSRLAALGNAVVPRWAYAVGLRVAELEAQRCARRTA